MIRTVTIGTVSAQGEVVSMKGDIATVRFGNKTFTGRLVGNW